jgi:hypothetical protein
MCLDSPWKSLPCLGLCSGPMSSRNTLTRFSFTFCRHCMTCPVFLSHFPGYLYCVVSYISSCGMTLTICFVRYLPCDRVTRHDTADLPSLLTPPLYINLSNRRNNTLKPIQPLPNPNQPLKSDLISPQLMISQSFSQSLNHSLRDISQITLMTEGTIGTLDV